jgi:hypothetical protein
MGAPQVVNLLKIANNSLPSVEYRYEQLQTHNNQLESVLKTKSQELQDVKNLISETSKNLDSIKLEYKREVALLCTTDLSYQSANAFCLHLSNDMMATVNRERSFLQLTQYEWCYFEHQ